MGRGEIDSACSITFPYRFISLDMHSEEKISTFCGMIFIMSFEELLIYLILAFLIIPAVVFFFGTVNEEENSRSANTPSWLRMPTFPTYRGNSILGTRNTDKPAAEAAINAIYKSSDLKAPLIVWTQSPLANVFAKTAIDYFKKSDCVETDIVKSCIYSFHDNFEQNDNIRKSAWKSLCQAGWSIGSVGTGHEVWHDVEIYEHRNDIYWGHIPPNTSNPLPNGLSNMNRSNAWFDIGDIVESRSNADWLTRLYIWSMVAIRYPDADTHTGEARAYNFLSGKYSRKLRHQKNLNCLSPQVPDLPDHFVSYPTDMRPEFQTLRDSAGWVMPYENICFVSERPADLKLDESERLHCETRPAMIYPDGFSVHAWHGTVFPEEWIEVKPTASEALSMQNTEQRRVACEMIGWETILRELHCVTIDKDEDPEIGELVSANMPNQGEDKFLRVTCGTGRKFALPVPPDMTTAREANAWTWGLEPEQYKPEVRT